MKFLREDLREHGVVLIPACWPTSSFGSISRELSAEMRKAQMKEI